MRRYWGVSDRILLFMLSIIDGATGECPNLRNYSDLASVIFAHTQAIM